MFVAALGIPRPAAAQESGEAASTEGESSAFARRDGGDVTVFGGAGWRRLYVPPDEAGGGFGALIGSNLHLGRNGALTTRLDWFQPTWAEDFQTDRQPSLNPVFSLAVGIRAQAPIGRSMLSTGLEVELFSSPPNFLPFPGPAATANYEYLVTDKWSVGISYRMGVPFLHRVGLTVGREF